MADAFQQVSQNTEAQKQGALAALATGGSAGQAAFNTAQAQIAAQRQAALGSAVQRSNLIGGPEAAAGNYTAPITNVANAGATQLSANAGSFGNLMKQMSANSADYFDKVKAAVPLVQAQAQASAAAKAQKSMTEAQKEATVLGQSQQDLGTYNNKNADALKSEQDEQSTIRAQLGQLDAAEVARTKQIRDIQAQNQMQGSLGSKMPKVPGQSAEASLSGPAQAQVQALVQQSIADSHKKEQLNQQLSGLDQKYGNPGNAKPLDIYQTAQQNAVKSGLYSPQEAQYVFSPQNTTLRDRIISSDPNVQQVETQLQKDIRSGNVKYKDTFNAKINAIAQSDPDVADYLARKYGSSVSDRPTQKSASAKRVSGG